MAETCVYKAITMVAGETFVLPPGAVLIGTTDSGAVTSSCPAPIPDTDLKCYVIQYVTNIDEDTTTKQVSPLGGLPGSIVMPSRNNAWDSAEGGPITITHIGGGGNITDTAVDI